MQLARRLFALASSTLIVGAVLFMPTAANARGMTTRVHIQQVSGKRAYHGRVISGRAACESGRRIRLYHEVPGPDHVVAKATSHASGTWRAQVPNRHYRRATFYYARIESKQLSGSSCAAAKSAYAQAF